MLRPYTVGGVYAMHRYAGQYSRTQGLGLGDDSSVTIPFPWYTSGTANIGTTASSLSNNSMMMLTVGVLGLYMLTAWGASKH